MGHHLRKETTGTKRNDREQIELSSKVPTKADALVATLDKLDRSMRNLTQIVHKIEESGASPRMNEMSVDTLTSAGSAFSGMLAAFAHFATDVRRE